MLFNSFFVYQNLRSPEAVRSGEGTGERILKEKPSEKLTSVGAKLFEAQKGRLEELLRGKTSAEKIGKIKEISQNCRESQKRITTPEISKSLEKIILYLQTQLESLEIQTELEERDIFRKTDFLRSFAYTAAGSPQINYRETPDSYFLSDFEKMKKLGIENVTFVPVFTQTRTSSGDIKLNENYQGAPRLEDLKRLTQLAHQSGLTVTIKPWYIIEKPIDPIRDWSGWIQGTREFFKNYEKHLLRLAKMAEESGVDLLVIGNELERTMDTEEEAKCWYRLIDRVRETYRGPITYAVLTDWKDKCPLWNKLDYIAANCWVYYMTREEIPPVETIKPYLRKWLDEAVPLAQKYHKPLIVSEIGFKSIKTTAWGTQRHIHSVLNEPVSPQAQANCYQAFFELLGEPKYQRWIKGVIGWSWTPLLDAPYKEKTIKESLGPWYTHNFHPKENAQKLIAQFYFIKDAKKSWPGNTPRQKDRGLSTPEL